MANEEQLRDDYTLNLQAEDNTSAPVDKAAASLDGYVKSAESAAAAVTGLGGTVKTAADQITAAGAAWDRVARRNDDVTAAAYRLKSAQEELTRVQALAARALEAGGADQDVVNRVLAQQTEKVRQLTAALIEVRAATEGAAEAAALWETRIEQGDELLTGLSASAAATAAAFTKGSAEAAVYGQSLASLRAQFDSVFKVSQAYEAELATLNKAFATGAIEGPVAQARALDDLNAKYARITGTADALLAKKQAETDASAKLVAQYAAERASFDSIYAASKQYEEQFNKLTAALEAGRINQAQFDVYLDKANATMATASRTAQAYSQSHGQAAFATRQLGVQTVQFFSSLESGIPFMTALVEQGHQLVDVALATGTGFEVITNAMKTAFGAIASPLGAAITSVTILTAGLVAMAFATEGGQKNLLSLQQTLRATRDDYASLAGEVNAAAKNVAASSTISRPDARAAGATIAGTFNFEGTQKDIESLIKLSGDLAVVWGTTVPDAAKFLSKAMEDPAKAAQELAEKHFPGMNAALVRNIERMQDSGHAADAYAQVLRVLEGVNGAAVDSMTPLQAALHRLGEEFSSTKNAADSAVAPVQGGLSRIATNTLNAVSNAIDALKGPDRPVNSMPMTPFQMYGGTQAQVQGPDFGPDSFGAGGGGADPGNRNLLAQQAAEAAKAVDDFNRVMQRANATVKDSPFGKLQDATDTAKALSDALATLGDRTDDNAAKFDTLTTALQITQKSLEEAEKAVALYGETATDKAVKATEAQAQGQRDIAAAYADGTDAVIQATAYAKAYEAALSEGLIPGTDKFTDAVIRLTVANVDNARAVGAVKAAEDSRNIDDQIELIKAETEAILNNTAANRANVQSIKDKQAVDKLGEAGASPDLQAHALAQRISLDAATADKQLATSAASLADKYKPAEVAQLNEKIGEFAAKLRELGPRTEENAATVDKYSNAIKGAEAEITRLNKTHEVHRAELDKQQDKVLAQIDATDKLTKAYGEGGEAVTLVTAQLQAQEKAISDNLKPGTDKYRAAVALLTDEFLRLGQSQANLKAVQESNDINQQIKLVQAETGALLENGDARTLMLQHMKDEYDVRKNNLGLSKPAQDALIAQKDALAQLTLEMNNQKQTVSYLSQQFSSAFDAIGTAITQTFVQGGGAAVKWGNVMQGVLTQVLQAFGHLAILNPLMNALTGGTAPTLSSVFSLLSGGGTSSGAGGALSLVSAGGGLLRLVSSGGGGEAASGVPGFGGGLNLIGTQATGVGSILAGGGAFGALGSLYASGVGQGRTTGSTAGGTDLLSVGSGLLSIGKAFFPGTFGTGTGSLFGNIGQSLGLTGQGGALTGITSFLNTPIYSAAGGFFPTFASSGVSAGEASFLSSAGISAPTAGVAGASAATIGSVIGGVGAGYGVGSIIGSYEQRALNKTGPAPQIGAALGAGIGVASVALAPETFGVSLLVGGLIGGALGGAAGGLIGPRPPSAFSSTMITVGDDGLLRVGGTASQRVDASSERAGAISDAAAINQMLQGRGLRITSLEGANTGAPYLQIGQNTPGGFQDPSKYSSFAAAFPSLRFSSPDALTNQFIQGRLFASPDELQGVTTSLADFENALKGTKAESDTMGIALRALAGVTNTGVQPALQKAATFITATFPALTAGAPGSLATAQSQVHFQYQDALNTAQQLGFGYDELAAAQQKAFDKNNKAAQDALDASAASVQSRFLTAQGTVSGSPQDAMNAQLFAFDANAKQARQQLSDTLTGIFGDAYTTSADYAQRMADNDKATAEERLAIQVQFNKQQLQIQQASDQQLAALQVRFATSVAALSGDPRQIQAAQVNALGVTQAQERAQYIQSEQQTYGDLFGTADPNNLDKWIALLSSQNNEMQLLQQQIARTNLQNQIASDQQNQGFSVRSANAQAALNPAVAPQAARYAFDVQAQQEQQALYLSLTATYGNAYAQTQEYADKLLALQKVQGEERLVLEQTLHDRQMQQDIANQQQDANLRTRVQNARAQLSGAPTTMATAEIDALRAQQLTERQSFQVGLLSTFGDAYASTKEYYDKLAALNDAQVAEMQLLQAQIDRASLERNIASQQQDQSFATRYTNAAAQVSGSVSDQNAAALAAFDAQAQAEIQNLYLSLTATYGVAYALTQDYANKLTALQKAQGEERLALQKQQDDALKSQAVGTISSLNQYAISLQTGDKSPLSPKAQLDLAQRQFETQAQLASHGNYAAVQTLQQYSEAYLAAAHTVFGSGMDYVQAFSKVISTLATVASQSPDALTASILQTETRTQTAILVEQLQELQDEVKQLRLQLVQGQTAPARVG